MCHIRTELKLRKKQKQKKKKKKKQNVEVPLLVFFVPHVDQLFDYRRGTQVVQAHATPVRPFQTSSQKKSKKTTTTKKKKMEIEATKLKRRHQKTIGPRGKEKRRREAFTLDCIPIWWLLLFQCVRHLEDSGTRVVAAETTK